MEPIGIVIGVILFIMFLLWLKWMFQTKERRRNFTEEEKRLILEKQKDSEGNYRCAMCDDSDYKYFQFHHKKPFCDGGLTNVDNGAACCAKCHDIFTRARNGKE